DLLTADQHVPITRPPREADVKDRLLKKVQRELLTLLEVRLVPPSRTMLGAARRRRRVAEQMRRHLPPRGLHVLAEVVDLVLRQIEAIPFSPHRRAKTHHPLDLIG